MGSGLDDIGISDDESSAQLATEPAVPATEPASSTPPDDELASNDTVTTLRAVGLLAELDVRQLGRLAELCDELTVPRGEYVFRHGDPGDGLYVVLDGAIRISREMPGLGEEALAIIRPGGHFGEVSLLDDGERSADAVGQEASKLLRLPRHALNELMWKDQDFGYELLWRFVRVLCSRLRESNDRLTMLAMTTKF